MKPIALKFLDSKLAELHGSPSYATSGAAAVDLRACIETPLILGPGKTEFVSSGVAMHIEDPNYATMMLPRSGLGAKHGLILGNTIGLFDSDYQGPLMMCLWNRSDTSYTIEPYERVAQLVLVRIEQAQFEVVNEFEETARAGGGFGHSGRH